MTDSIVYIDRSDVREGAVEALKEGVSALVEFVHEHEPQLIAYSFHINEEARRMTVVAVHPDSASMEFHLEVAGAEFRRLADLLTLRSIEVYGRPSEKVLDGLHQKARALGEGGTVVVEEPHAGFSRMEAAEA